MKRYLEQHVKISLLLGNWEKIKRCLRIPGRLCGKLLCHRLLLVCTLFFLSLIVIINIIFAWTQVWFFDNLIASTGLLQQQRREPCAGHTLASVSLCRLTSLSVGSRRVTEGGSHHNHCRGCELGGETQTSAVIFFEETGLMLTSLWRMREQVILIHSLEVAARNCFLF